MKSEPLVTSSQRSYQLADFSILSETCLFDQGNPSTCPMHEIRERSLKERLAWFDRLSEEARVNIHTYCQLCLESREHPTIELLAYCIYLAEGRPEGRALQHWLEAEEPFEVEEQFEAESGLEPNIFGDKAVEHLKIGGLKSL